MIRSPRGESRTTIISVYSQIIWTFFQIPRLWYMHFANTSLGVVVAKCCFLGFVVWERTYVFSIYRNPVLDDRIFDCLLTSMAAVQAEDVRASFLFVGDLNSLLQKWLGSTTTSRHGVAAFDFATVSGCDQLVVGPTNARGGTLDLLMTDVPDLVWVSCGLEWSGGTASMSCDGRAWNIGSVYHVHILVRVCVPLSASSVLSITSCLSNTITLQRRITTTTVVRCGCRTNENCMHAEQIIIIFYIYFFIFCSMYLVLFSSSFHTSQKNREVSGVKYFQTWDKWENPITYNSLHMFHRNDFSNLLSFIQNNSYCLHRQYFSI